MGSRAGRPAIERDAFLAVLKAARDLERTSAELLKAHDLSLAQYNVLRILRGAGEAGSTCGQIGSQLIKHDPDVTRLLDRLERSGLIERARDARDRRVVRTRITRAGLAVLSDLDKPVEELHRRQFGHMSQASLEALGRLLDQARSTLE